MATATTTNIGHITQVIGSTFDAEFPEESLPKIYNALVVETKVKSIPIKVVGEVQQHLGGGRVRCVALSSTDGMVRGMEVTDTGASLSVPVGKETLGRVFNLLGDPIDGQTILGELDDVVTGLQIVVGRQYWPLSHQGGNHHAGRQLGIADWDTNQA